MSLWWSRLLLIFFCFWFSVSTFSEKLFGGLLKWYKIRVSKISTLHTYKLAASLGSVWFPSTTFIKRKKEARAEWVRSHTRHMQYLETQHRKAVTSKNELCMIAYCCLSWIFSGLSAVLSCGFKLITWVFRNHPPSTTLFFFCLLVSARPRKVINTTTISRLKGVVSLWWSRLLLIFFCFWFSVSTFSEKLFGGLLKWYKIRVSKISTLHTYKLAASLGSVWFPSTTFIKRKKEARAEWVRSHTRHMQYLETQHRKAVTSKNMYYVHM